MAKHTNPGKGAADDRSNATDGDAIARLMRLAGPRPEVPRDVRERVHAAVQKEWRSSVRQRRTFRWGIPAALAATVVIAIAVASRGPEIRVAPVATVAFVGGGAGGGYSVGDEIRPGEAVVTEDDGISLALKNGLSVRFAAGSEATFASVEELSLRTGQVYADTGDTIYDDRSITIRTDLASVTDVGTRFAVSYLDGDMSVAVREGRVDVSHRHGTYSAETGDRLILGASDDVVLEEVSPEDEYWEWAANLAPAFDIENRPLLDFLKWASRETGKELVFESEDIRLDAMSTRLSGSVSDLELTPAQAVDVVMPTTRFGWRVDEGRIVISRPSH